MTASIIRIAVPALTLAAAFAAPARAEQQPSHLCSDAAQAVALEGARSRLILGGTAYDNRVLEWPGGHAHFGDFAVARLLPDGAPDPTFGKQGNVILSVGDFDDVQDVALVQGKVVAAGTTAPRAGAQKGPGDVVILRLTNAGKPDHKFGNHGIVRVDLGGDESVAGISAGPFGQLYVAGTVRTPSGADGFVLRLQPDGALDSCFGSKGVARIDTGSVDDKLLGVRAVLGGVVAGGQASVSGEAAAVVVRLDDAGQPVHRFGERGMVIARIGGTPGFDGFATHTLFGSSAVGIMRQSPDGTAQVATVLVGPAGRVLSRPGLPSLTLDVPGGSLDAPSAGAFTWDGQLYLSGSSYVADFSTGDAFIARVDMQGQEDEGFAGGVVTQRQRLEYAAFNDLAVDHRGVVAAGWDFGEQPATLPPSDALVARYRPDGSLDSRFGMGGVVLHDFRNGAAVCGPLVHVE